MSGALLKKELRANGPLAAIFLGVVTLYGSMITSMFDPKLGDSLNIMMESMPELFAAFGMSNPGASLTQFLANYLYGFLLIALPLVMILLLVQRLLVRYTDRGAMAWLLASPTPRWKLALTQAFVLVAAVVLLVGYMTGLCGVLAQVLFPGELEFDRFALVNLGDLGLLLFFAGAALRLFKTPLRQLIQVLGNTVLGFAALALLNLTEPLTGIALGVNLLNALVIGILGVPGLGLLLLAQWLFT